MTSPLVSIIVPIYNVEAYLRECLNSVIAQTYGNWECIMIDDASTDSSASIAEEFCRTDSRFRLIRHSTNRGQSDARNTGLDVTSGERIMFVDSDDVIHPDILSLGMMADADIVCFDLDYSQARFEKLRKLHIPDCDYVEHDAREALMLLLYQSGRLNSSPCSKLFKARMFDENRFISGLTYEDLEMICRLFGKADSIIDCPLKMYFYRQRPGSYMHRWSNKRLDVLKVTECIEKQLDNDRELLRAAQDRRFAANFNMLLLMRRNGLSESMEAEDCRSNIRRLRAQVLSDSRSRLKNRMGALLSYLVM